MSEGKHSQDLEGMSMAGSGTSTTIPVVSPDPPKRGTSSSKGHFVLREIIVGQEVSLRQVCVICHPQAANMQLSRDELTRVITEKANTAEMKKWKMKNDPAGTFANIGPTTPRNNHLAQVHADTRSPPQEAPQMAADTRIPGLTALEQDYLWMFVDLVMAPNVLRKPSFRKIHPGCPFDSPSTFRTKLKVMSSYTREEVKGKMRNHSCFLLMDGGSILSKGLMNIAVGINRACGVGCDIYFYRSVNVRNGKAATLAPIVKEHVDEIKENGGSCFAIVTDNASNMALTVKILVKPEGTVEGDTDDEDDEGFAFDEDDENVVGEEEIEMEVGELPDGIIHIKCFAHTFQLLFGDLCRGNPMIKKAFATVSRIVHLMQCREFKFDLTKALDDHDVVKKAFKQPAATRWNSTVRAMVRIEGNFEVLNSVLLDRGQRILLPSEREALRGAIVVLTPIAWATDAVQRDTCSADMALDLVRKTRETWRNILETLKPQEKQQAVVQRCNRPHRG